MNVDAHSAWLIRRALNPNHPFAPALEHWSIAPKEHSHPAFSSALQELEHGLTSLRGKAPTRLESSNTEQPGVRLTLDPALPPESFRLHTTALGPLLAATDPPSLLRGVHYFLRQISLHCALPSSPTIHSPRLDLRLVSQWDNLDGSIERGYAGRSIFSWHDISSSLPRVTAYARLLASLGLNGIVLNNVTAQADFLAPKIRPALARVADVFRAHGLRIFLSINSGAPIQIGGLPDADPLNPMVRDWWRNTAAALYDVIPDFGGFCVKADCEGVPGPLTYGRSHAEGANCLAAALAPFGGIVLWRTFVYPLPEDSTTYEYFRTFDGAFADNVVLMIKNGPVDFQPIEPLHPLFGQTPRTRQLLELQAIQEYTGQTTHICHLGGYWSQLLAEDLGTNSSSSRPLPLRDHLASPAGAGIAAVSNIGDHPNWFLHPLNGANLYVYGRLAWDPAADPSQLLNEWVRLTFGEDPEVLAVTSRILLESHSAYVSGTHPFGLPFLTDYDHFRPMPEKRVHMHEADENGIGKDRSNPSMTGSWTHYPDLVAQRYGNPTTCPESLLLFFHQLPWEHRLADGRSLAEAFESGIIAYPEKVADWQEAWDGLAKRIDPALHESVRERLQAQHSEALLWKEELLAFFGPLASTREILTC